MKKYQYLASWDDQTLTRVGEPVVVLGDSNVSQVEVILPSNFLLDPTGAVARMYFLLPGEKESGFETLETATKDENGDSHVTWTIKHVHSQKGGRLAFSLTLIGDDAQWNSQTAIIPVYESRYQPESEEAEEPYTGRLAILEGDMAAIRGEFGDVVDEFEELKETATLGTPIPKSLASEMVEGGVYLYTGTETGYTAGHVYYYVNGTLTDGGQYGGIALDDTLTSPTMAAPASEVGQIKEDLSTKTGLSEEAKQALLACFAKVAWTDEHGQDYYDVLEDALYPPANLVSISAVYTQSGTVYDTGSLDILKSDLVVTAHYSDSTSGLVTGYTLSGTLAEGTSTVTVSYGGKTTTFNVTVTHKEALVPTEYQQVEYIEGTGNQYIRTSVITANNYLKMTAKYFKATQATKNEDIFYGLTQTQGGTNGFEVGFSTTANRIYAYSSTSAYINDAGIYNSVCDLEAVFKPSSPYATLKIVSNGTTLTGEKTSANTSDFNNKIVCILGVIMPGGYNYCASARLYSANLYNVNDELLFEGIPCYRKSDGVIGMYDRVSSTFITNAGTGTFLKGANI